MVERSIENPEEDSRLLQKIKDYFVKARPTEENINTLYSITEALEAHIQRFIGNSRLVIFGSLLNGLYDRHKAQSDLDLTLILDPTIDQRSVLFKVYDLLS
jgi:DNA polymerase sigma